MDVVAAENAADNREPPFTVTESELRELFKRVRGRSTKGLRV